LVGKLLQELFQIIVAIEDKYASREVIEEQKFHEPHLQQAYIEALFDHPFQIS
jgi:hypothetical protein